MYGHYLKNKMFSKSIELDPCPKEEEKGFILKIRIGL